MNWLLIIFIAFIIYEMISGYRRGFATMLLSLLTIVIAVATVIVVAPFVKKAVVEHTEIETKLTEKISDKIVEKVHSETDLPKVLDGIHLPQSLKEKLGLKAESISGTLAEKVKGVAQSIADVVITAGVYVATFIVVLILLWILGRALHLVGKIPVLGTIDGILGLVFSLLEAVIVTDAVFLIIMAISGTGLGETLTGMIHDSKILSFFYEHNLLSMAWGKMFTGA